MNAFTTIPITAIVVVIIAGIGSFILLTFLKKKAHSIVMEVDLAFLSALDKLNFLIGHYIEVSVDIQEIDIDRLGFFINYGWFAGIISRLEQKDTYDKVYKSVLFRGLRSQIEEPVKLGKAQMDFGVEFIMHFLVDLK